MARRRTQRRRARRTRRARTFKKQRGGQAGAPTFHVLLTSGGRKHLEKMLASLKGELKSEDAITLVFDGPQAYKDSGFQESWLDGFAPNLPITVIRQGVKTGNWSHVLRNNYQGRLLPKTTFVMHADDDDKYVAGGFNLLRESCKDPTNMYVIRMKYAAGNLIPVEDVIREANIGTPCVVIPFDMAGQSEWTMEYIGDFKYIKGLETKLGADKVKFLPHVIYEVVGDKS